MRDVIKGLCKMSEECQVMHRDLKLENILVKSKHPQAAAISDFEFKIGDMGLARRHGGEHLLHGTYCGSPMYMAPEILLNQPYNHQADIWSLGTIFYHLLTGNYPFDSKSLAELKSKIQKGIYQIPNCVRLSSQALDFIDGCLKFDYRLRLSIKDLKTHPFYQASKLIYPEISQQEFQNGR
jgi:serine/threonine protein kinase